MKLRGSVVHSDMDRIIGLLKEGEKTIPRDTAVHINDQGQLTSPVDTGHMVMSHVVFSTSPTSWTQTVRAMYGLYVNFGTRNMAAQPWWSASVVSGQVYLGMRVRTWLR